jgi:hypothetical protein
MEDNEDDDDDNNNPDWCSTGPIFR